MRYGDAARLLRIVEEVRLHVFIGVVADDFNGVLVGTHGTVGTEPVEFAGSGAGGSRVELLGEIQRGVGNVLVNTYGEVVFRFFPFKVFIYGKHHGGREFFGAQAVSAAVYLYAASAFFGKRRAYVEIQRFAEGAGFFGSVKHGEFFAGSGNRVYERRGVERAVQADLQKTVLLALGVERVDRFFDGFGAAAHNYDNFFRVFRAHVIEEVILSARVLRNDFHHFGYDTGNGRVMRVCGFSVLEVGIGVLRRTFLDGMFGVQGAGFEVVHVFLHAQLIENRFDFGVVVRFVESFDFGIFVRSTEAVEEVQERHGGLQRGKVRHKRKIHHFLYGRRSQHRKARLAAGHHVGVVAEDVQRVRRKRTGGYVHYHGQKFAGNLVHVGNH